MLYGLEPFILNVIKKTTKELVLLKTKLVGEHQDVLAETRAGRNPEHFNWVPTNGANDTGGGGH